MGCLKHFTFFLLLQQVVLGLLSYFQTHLLFLSLLCFDIIACLHQELLFLGKFSFKITDLLIRSCLYLPEQTEVVFIVVYLRL